MKRNLINLLASLMGSLTACICMLLIVFSLQKQEDIFSSKIQTLTAELSREKNHLHTLRSTTKILCDSMQFHPSKDVYADNNDFIKCAKQNHLKSLELTALPPETLYHDKKMTLRKIPVRMNFLLTKDQNFWKFLQSLQESFPGSTLMQFLSIERIYFKEKQGIFLKGSFHFDWYHLLLAPENP
jgi:hypothetical protein